ncbi:hypothetical protein [Alsobacter sp. R-9]
MFSRGRSIVFFGLLTLLIVLREVLGGVETPSLWDMIDAWRR